MSELPEWLTPVRHSPGSSPRIGVAIGVTDRHIPLVHSGLLYWDTGEGPRVLHLAFHCRLKDESLPSSDVDYYWSELPVSPLEAEVIAGFCRQVAKRPSPIKYAVVYEGGRLSDDGTAVLDGRTIGLTCATYVLSLLATYDLFLLDTASWTPRAEDAGWHQCIVCMLRQHRERFGVTDEHIAAVEGEAGCARFRPEEVAAAAPLKEQWQVPMSVASPRGEEARRFMVAAAKAV